jgi:hypothetical protein
VVDGTLQDRIRRAFSAIHGLALERRSEVSTGISVDVFDAGIAIDTPTYILITPWTINGLAFPPDDDFPSALEIDGRVRIVHAVDDSDLGPHCAVNLVPLGAHFPSPVHARKVARDFAPKFRRAVEEARVLTAALR